MSCKGFTEIKPGPQNISFAPLYYRARSLNPGIMQRAIITAALPDPRLYDRALVSMAQMYAIQLKEFHHVKDPNLKRFPLC